MLPTEQAEATSDKPDLTQVCSSAHLLIVDTNALVSVTYGPPFLEPTGTNLIFGDK